MMRPEGRKRGFVQSYHAHFVRGLFLARVLTDLLLLIGAFLSWVRKVDVT
jgi:hypothetical protein